MYFDIKWLDRDATREQWNKLRAVLKKTGDWRSVVRNADPLAIRVEEAAALAACTVAGETGIVESGRDCDCVVYCYGRVETFSGVMAFEKFRDEQVAGSDGIHYVSMCRPDDLPESESRDLAMEAYEDGHAHVVSTARFDEYGGY